MANVPISDSNSKSMTESTHKCPNCSTVFIGLDSKVPPPNPSPVPREILDTNYPPSEFQLSSIRDFISRGRAYIQILDDKAALLRPLILQALTREIWKHEGSMSLLRGMPTEILSTIFAFTSTTEQAPWTVSAVCVRWRAIATSQPNFWTSIRLPSPPGSFMNTLRLERQLQRSGELPLDIEFSMEDGSLKNLALFPLLCAQARRWGRFSIDGPDLLYSQLVNLVKDRLVLLQELEFEVECPEGEIPALNIFHDAPLMQKAVVNKVLWNHPLAMRLPWSQISCFRGSSSWVDHLGALGAAANLVECSLEIQGPGEPPRTPILLPNLRCLSLSHAAFLECLDTPALLELYCDYAPPLLPFLRRNIFELQTLVIWECFTPAAESDLTRILDAVPTLRNLGLDLPLTAEFVSQFCSSNTIPVLECILAANEAIDIAINNRFAEGVESRWKSGRLKSVKLFHWDPPAADLLCRMELLQAQGMDFLVFRDRNGFLEDLVPYPLRIFSPE
ncbi:hypothetical protein B0H16DRAFT_1534474 [Mycena metata]|uniref:F-box domain-containing protein n=1 Tax=Mycena metata TaxID=1033252 RepID=A0AAD7NFS8_9AGAR|nr:hypothetical protein B0H16DRAFT_1534474 [Mycena metata]